MKSSFFIVSIYLKKFTLKNLQSFSIGRSIFQRFRLFHKWKQSIWMIVNNERNSLSSSSFLSNVRFECSCSWVNVNVFVNGRKKSQFWINWSISLKMKLMWHISFIHIDWTSLLPIDDVLWVLFYLEQSTKNDFFFSWFLPSDLTGVMDRLRQLDPRRRASEQKMQQTSSTTSHISTSVGENFSPRSFVQWTMF